MIHTHISHTHTHTHIYIYIFKAAMFSCLLYYRVFKRFFSADLFELFIGVGHYCVDINKYKEIVQCINSLPAKQLQTLHMVFFQFWCLFSENYFAIVLCYVLAHVNRSHRTFAQRFFIIFKPVGRYN